jgi:threonine dehydratase
MNHPTLNKIEEALNSIGNYVRQTPVWEWKGSVKDNIFGSDTTIILKLELFQHGGSFKTRGAMVNMLALTPEQLECGVTAVSAGNHAIAVAYAAKLLGSSAKVVMPSTANPYRVTKCEELGAEVVLMENVHQAFAEAERIQKEEGRTFVHPFEGFNTVLGTATCGYEFITQAQNLDLAIIPIGGGGLIAGMAAAIKQVNPNCKVIGVEPEGADSMTRSLKSGKPEGVEKVTTIADSLGAPYALPYSFSVVQKFVDEVMLISDQEMCEAMALLFTDAKLAVEPAGAASTAALKKIVKSYQGKKIGLMVCGANIDPENFAKYLKQGGIARNSK